MSVIHKGGCRRDRENVRAFPDERPGCCLEIIRVFDVSLDDVKADPDTFLADCASAPNGVTTSPAATVMKCRRVIIG